MNFVREPVPPSFRDLLPKWKERARNLGPEAPKVFLEMLARGRFDEQYASVLALREYGYEASGHGYGPAFIFKVKAPGTEEWITIAPLYPDDKGYRAEDGKWVEFSE